MSCDCLCYVMSVFLAVPWFGLQCLTVVFPNHTNFFYQALQMATRLENQVQLFNAESHAIGIKPVHGIEDAIAKYVSKEMAMYMSMIILTQKGTYNCQAIILLC